MAILSGNGENFCARAANFGFFHMRRGMHFGDGGIVRLVNPCGVGVAMELELLGHGRQDQSAARAQAVESAKDTIS